VKFYRFRFMLLATILLAFNAGGSFGSVRASPPRRDHYQVLGIARSASPLDIKKAFRKFAVQFHPDKNLDQSAAVQLSAEEQFKQINAAYETLSNPEKRKAYDIETSANHAQPFDWRNNSPDPKPEPQAPPRAEQTVATYLDEFRASAKNGISFLEVIEQADWAFKNKTRSLDPVKSPESFSQAKKIFISENVDAFFKNRPDSPEVIRFLHTLDSTYSGRIAPETKTWVKQSFELLNQHCDAGAVSTENLNKMIKRLMRYYPLYYDAKTQQLDILSDFIEARIRNLGESAGKAQQKSDREVLKRAAELLASDYETFRTRLNGQKLGANEKIYLRPITGPEISLKSRCSFTRIFAKWF